MTKQEKEEKQQQQQKRVSNHLAKACENADNCEKKRPIQYQVACTVNPEWISQRKNKANEREPVPCE